MSKKKKKKKKKGKKNWNAEINNKKSNKEEYIPVTQVTMGKGIWAETYDLTLGNYIWDGG